uniref:NB-ARC domain-containing protein n=1 Tax=Fagus sylvatica TaxID=28930 RepID=A0A2N9F195_FAGSY
MEIVISIVAKIGEYLVEPIGQQFGYLIHLNSNIQNLKQQFQKLNDKRKGLQLEIDVAKRNAEDIAPEVEGWVQKVDNISQGLQRFIDEDVKATKMCLNLKSHYSLSRKAKKKTLEIDGLLRDAQPFVIKVSYAPPPPQGIGSSSIEDQHDCHMRYGGDRKNNNGKRRLAKRAKDDKLFDEVAIAVVSHNQDLRKIQGQIADMLGLELKKESEAGRADQLKSRLMLSKSVLVILDDVWDVLNLEEVGIPYGDLSKEEAWNLFREMAGNCVDTPDLRPIAKEVAKECGGLPVAIVTVGRALENKIKDEWIAALEQLKKSIPKNIPEDFDIPIEYLVRYGVGRSWKEECVKMHDVVRDVAISIADEHGFLVGCDDKMEEWPEKDTYGNYVAISLFSREMKKHPDGLECSKLELLQLSCGKDTPQMLPANMFQGMKELKGFVYAMYVLFVTTTINPGPSRAFGHYIWSIELPREIGNLGHLKLLDLSECFTLKRIPYGLLSSLSRLEELYMGGVVVKWEPLEGNGEGNASLAELNSLSHHLMALEIIIPSIKLLPKDLHFKNQMIKFHMYIGNPSGVKYWKRPDGYLFKNTLSLESRDLSDIVESLMLRQLLQRSENLKLKEIGNLKNLKDVEYVIDATSDQNLRAAFPSLERLELVVLDNLEKIYDGQFPKRSFSGAQYACFGNLIYLRVFLCHRLKNVFSLSMARGLVQLQELIISNCHNLEEIFSKEGEDEKAVDMIKFPKLTLISLDVLPRLIGFCKPMDPVELVQPSHAKSTQPSSNLEVARMETNELTKDKMTDNQDTGSFPESRPISSKLFSSKTILCIEINKCDVIEDIVQRDGEEEAADFALFPKVSSFIVKELPNLVTFCKEAYSLEWSSMREIKIFAMRCLECVPHSRNYGPMVESNRGTNNKSHGSSSVVSKEKIEEILTRAREDEEEKNVLFNKVNLLVLMDLPNLKCFCNEANAFEWPSLKKVGVIRCPNLRTFVPANLKTPELEGVYEDSHNHRFYDVKLKERAQWKGDLNATIENIIKGKEPKVDYETQQQQTETIEKNM